MSSMPNSFPVILDSTPVPQVMINGGALATSDPGITVSIYAPTRLEGPKHIDAVMILGDVNTAADPSIQANVPNSSWMPYRHEYKVILSPGAGTKEITVYLRSRSRTTSSNTASIAYTVNAAAPIVNMLRVPATAWKDNRIATFAQWIEFDYTIDQDCTQIEIRGVTTASAPRTAGTQIRSTGGTFVAGGVFTSVGLFPSLCRVSMADIVAAGGLAEGPSMVKVFARRVGDGVWSS